jgi:FtsH-binding integral membrane protein
MDEIFTKGKLQIAIPVLFGAIYFSAFKNGKQTCDRYFLNYFLYLLMSLALYYYTMNEVNINLKGLSIIAFIGVIGCLIAFYMVENVYLKHLLWLILIVCIGIISKRFYEKFNKEDIKDALKKLIIILIVCVLLALTFPHVLKPKIEVILIFALLITLLLRLIDHFFYDKKYSKTLTYVVVFIFSAFIMYDTKRVIEFSKKCVDGKTGYLDNVFDMFLNVTVMFENLLKLGE